MVWMVYASCSWGPTSWSQHFSRECPQPCGKMNDLFSSSINGPKWWHILVGFIVGPWLICTDFCLFPWGFSQHLFFLVEKLCVHFHDIFRCIQLFRHLSSYCVTPPEVHEPPEGKESLEPPCPPATPTVAWILGLLCRGFLLFLANFIFQELSSVFKN